MACYQMSPVHQHGSNRIQTECEDNVFDSLDALFGILRIFGLMAYTYKCENVSRKLVRSVHWCVWSCVVLSLEVVGIVLVVSICISYIDIGKLDVVGWSLITQMCHGVLIFILAIALHNMKLAKIIEICEMINKSDKILTSSLLSEKSHALSQKFHGTLFASFFFIFFKVVVVFCGAEEEMELYHPYVLVTYIVSLLDLLLVFLFVSFSMIMFLRFDILKLDVSKILDDFILVTPLAQENMSASPNENDSSHSQNRNIDSHIAEIQSTNSENYVHQTQAQVYNSNPETDISSEEEPRNCHSEEAGQSNVLLTKTRTNSANNINIETTENVSSSDPTNINSNNPETTENINSHYLSDDVTQAQALSTNGEIDEVSGDEFRSAYCQCEVGGNDNNSFEKAGESSPNERKLNKLCERIKILRIIYISLCEIIEHINYTLGVYLLLSFAYNFIQTVVCLFYLIYFLCFKPDYADLNWCYILNAVLSIVLSVLIICGPVVCCTKVSQTVSI